jgi:hypothetical protein
MSCYQCVEARVAAGQGRSAWVKKLLGTAYRRWHPSLGGSRRTLRARLQHGPRWACPPPAVIIRRQRGFWPREEEKHAQYRLPPVTLRS